MARGIFRKPSFARIVGAYRSQWKRFLLRLFLPFYGKRGVGWFRNPKKALYNWWYNRSSISIARMLGYRPSWVTCVCAFTIAAFSNVFTFPVDVTRAGRKAYRINKARKERVAGSSFATNSGRISSDRVKRHTESVKRSSSSSSFSTYTPTSTQQKAQQRTSSSQSDVTRSERKTYKINKSRIIKSSTAKKKLSSSPKKYRASSDQVKKYTEVVPKETVKRKLSQSSVSISTKKNERQKSLQRTVSAQFPKNPVYPKHDIKPIPQPVLIEEKHVQSAIAEPVVKEEEKVEQINAQIIVEPDENTPKSKPKNENNQYIRKRMIIAGSSYCDSSVLERLTVGSYLELVAEPDNPYDKNAVMLLFDGQKVGYIPKQDNMPFATCLKLKRKMYGVITDIITETHPVKYEFETWFDS